MIISVYCCSISCAGSQRCVSRVCTARTASPMDSLTRYLEFLRCGLVDDVDECLAEHGPSSSTPNFVHRPNEQFFCGHEVLLDVSDAAQAVRKNSHAQAYLNASKMGLARRQSDANRQALASMTRLTHSNVPFFPFLSHNPGKPKRMRQGSATTPGLPKGRLRLV